MLLRLFLSMLIVVLLGSGFLPAEEPVTVTTWNIEHLGSPGRGFGGGFGGFGVSSVPENSDPLPFRTEEDLNKIANLIRNELHSDILALQEIGITKRPAGRSRSDQLDKIVAALEESGETWNYFLPHMDKTPAKNDEHNIFPAFVWNMKKARLLNVFEMNFQNQVMAGKSLFDRKPLVGYFEALREDGTVANDFVLVNVHLASGQDNDENHLIAMTLIEAELSRELSRHAVRESDRIILGDFNDNPASKNTDGSPRYSPALYEHMKFKGYDNLTSLDFKTTRMNKYLNSLIDHILVNKFAKADVTAGQATIFKPGGGDGDSTLFADWRKSFSDHFPLSFQIKVRNSDNDSDFFKE